MSKHAERVGGFCPAAAFLQDSHDFFSRLFGIAFADRVRENLADIRSRREALHHRLVRRENDVVVILSEIAGAFRLQCADDLQGNVPVADGLADGIAFGEQVLDDGLPDDADLGHAVRNIVEHYAVLDFVITNLQVVCGNSAQGRGGVVVADNRLPAYGHHRRDSVNVGGVFADGDDVRFFEEFAGRFLLHTAAAVAVRHDDNGVRTHRGHLFLDGDAGTFAHGDHSNHSRNTDHDAKHRKESAHAVTEQRLECNLYKSKR